MIDMVGKKYGNLFIVEQFTSDRYGSNRDFCVCLCDCGKTKTINGKNIRRGMTSSCGCIRPKAVFDACHKTNSYRNVDNSTMEGIDGKGRTFLFSKSKFKLIKDHCWNIDGNGYAHTRIGGKSVYLHNLVMGKDSPYEVDHINRIRNDNRDENLRNTSRQMNAFNKNTPATNTSGIMGVSKVNNFRWHSFLSISGKRINKYSDNFWDAVVSRLKMEKEFLGEFSPQKYLFEEYGIK